jgi:hypothetical protein
MVQNGGVYNAELNQFIRFYFVFWNKQACASITYLQEPNPAPPLPE